MKYRSNDMIIISVSPDMALAGIRVKSRTHSLNILDRASVSGGGNVTCETLMENLQKIAAELHKTRNSIVYLTGLLPSSVFFELNIPKMSSREIKDALLMELDSKMPMVPMEVCLNWMAQPSDGEEEFRIKACACDAAELSLVGKALAMLHWKIDGYIPTLLALPSEASVYFREFGADFARKNNSWYPVTSSAKEKFSAETQEFIQKITAQKISPEDTFLYGSCAAAAAAAAKIHPKGTITDYSIFNGSLRPKRLRGHIIYMLLMLALLAVAGTSALWSGMAGKAGEYRKLSGKLDSLTQEISRTKRKIKTAEKDDKDFQKILEAFHGEDKLLQRLTRISSVIPGDVLLSDLKVNENSWDINCLTESAEVDLAGTFRRIPGFKLKNIEQRPTRQEMTTISIRLEVTDRGRKK